MSSCFELTLYAMSEIGLAQSLHSVYVQIELYRSVTWICFWSSIIYLWYELFCLLGHQWHQSPYQFVWNPKSLSSIYWHHFLTLHTLLILLTLFTFQLVNSESIRSYSSLLAQVSFSYFPNFPITLLDHIKLLDWKNIPSSWS